MTEDREFAVVIRVAFEVTMTVEAEDEAQAESVAEVWGERVACAVQLDGRDPHLDAYPENFDWTVESVTALDEDEDED